MSEQNHIDESNFGRLFAKYQPRIYGFIRSLLLHRQDAEDVLQETGAVLWRRFPEFQPDSNFLAWALSVARFQVMYFRQKQKRNVLRFSDELHEVLAADMVAESVRLSDLQQFIDECMQKLPLADQELLKMRCGSNVPTKTLAEQLGRPASTIYNTLNRIRRMLAKCVERAMNA